MEMIFLEREGAGLFIVHEIFRVLVFLYINSIVLVLYLGACMYCSDYFHGISVTSLGRLVSVQQSPLAFW